MERRARLARVALAASVLTMRSSGDASQPATDERGNALCWNGEWFQGGPAPDAADARDERREAERARAGTWSGAPRGACGRVR